MTHRSHEPRPGEDADDDGRRAVQHIGDEADRPAQAAGAVLGEVDAGADADGEPDQAGGSHDDRRADDRVGDAAARLADGHGGAHEEVPVDRRRSLVQEVGEDEDQRQDGRRTQ